MLSILIKMDRALWSLSGYENNLKIGLWNFY